MKIIHELTLDVSRQGIQACVPVTQHDSGIHTLVIHLRNGSKELKLNKSLTATLYISNDSFENVTIYTENGAYPNTLECPLTPNMTKNTGELTAQLQIFESADRMTSCPEFIIAVKADRSNNSEVKNSSPFSAVIAARDAAVASAQDAESAMLRAEQAADNASSTATEVATSVATEVATEKAREISESVVGELASNALKGKVENWDGSALLLDDVSPLGHKIAVKTRSKNLATINSFTVPYTGDTTIFEGKITGNFAFSFDDNLTGVVSPSAGLFEFIVDGKLLYVTSNGWSQSTDKIFTFSGTLTKVCVLTWNGATGGSLDNIQLERGLKKTKFVPYIPDDTVVTVKSCGKNLVSESHFPVPLPTEQLIFNGNITGDFVLSYDDTLGDKEIAGGTVIVYVVDGVPYTHGKGWGNPYKFSGTLTKVYIRNGTEAKSGSVDNIQIEVGMAKTEFEPYKEGETITTTLAEGAELTSISPNMTIYTDNANVIPEATYNKDANKVIEKLTEAIISLGGNI